MMKTKIRPTGRSNPISHHDRELLGRALPHDLTNLHRPNELKLGEAVPLRRTELVRHALGLETAGLEPASNSERNI